MDAHSYRPSAMSREVTAEVGALFILPRWARELREKQAERPDRFE